MKRLITDADHQRVLDSAEDVPEESPKIPLLLNEVGICRKTAWVELPEGRLPFEAEIAVDLQADKRGIHMSRIERSMTELSGISFPDIRRYAFSLASQVIAQQASASCRVKLTGKLPLIQQGPVSGLNSMDAVEIETEVIANQDLQQPKQYMSLSAGIYHITACPCTQAYNRQLFEVDDDALPLPTHSQRSFTKLTVQATHETPTYGELIDILRASLHATQDLLKRSDEAELVLQSHRFPQFAEDAVRETAANTVNYFSGRLPGTTMIAVYSRSFESIHIHDVYCRLNRTLAELEAELKTDFPKP